MKTGSVTERERERLNSVGIEGQGLNKRSQTRMSRVGGERDSFR